MYANEPLLQQRPPVSQIIKVDDQAEMFYCILCTETSDTRNKFPVNLKWKLLSSNGCSSTRNPSCL